MNDPISTKRAGINLDLRTKAVIVLLALSLVPIFFVTKSAFVALAQRTTDTETKRITRTVFKNEPIEILELSSNGRKLNFDETFKSAEWLRSFSIKFKNISQKTITSLSIDLDFPETKSSGLLMVYTLRYGVNPIIKDFKTEDLRSLAAGNMDTVTLDPTSYGILTGFLSRRVVPNDLTVCNIQLSRIDFSDGTHWAAGDLFYPDPTRPGKFTVRNPTE